MSAKDLRFGTIGPAMLFGGAAVLAVGGLLWLQHGGAVFQELVLSGLALCL